MIYIKKIMKKSKIKLINILVIIVAVAFIFIILNIYKQSPRYIIKDTVMWYEKDFTIPLFCKKVKFEYPENFLHNKKKKTNGELN